MRQVYARHDARGLHETVGGAVGYHHEERREPHAELVRECFGDVHGVTAQRKNIGTMPVFKVVSCRGVAEAMDLCFGVQVMIYKTTHMYIIVKRQILSTAKCLCVTVCMGI